LRARTQISLTIDGKGVGYNKLCSPDTTSTTFDGFCTYCACCVSPIGEGGVKSLFDLL
jgi:hypothetical protein